MGLDINISLKHKLTEQTVTLAYFRNYYELRDWVTENCPAIDKDGYEFVISNLNVEKLYNEIKRFARAYSCLSEDEITLFEEQGIILFSQHDDPIYHLDGGSDFNPRSSNSSFAVHKLLNLYHFLEIAINAIDWNMWEDYDLIFYQSY